MIKKFLFIIFITTIVANTNVFALECEIEVSPQINLQTGENGPAPLKVDLSIIMDLQNTLIPFVEWDFGDGEISNIPFPMIHSHIYEKPGEYSLVYRVKSVRGNFECETTIVVGESSIIEPEPEVSLIANQITGNAPLEVEFKSLVKNGEGPFEYVYSFGDDTKEEITSSEDEKISHIYTTTGKYQASVTITDGDSNSYTSSVDIVVFDVSLPIVVSLSSDKTEGNLPLDVRFEATILSGEERSTQRLGENLQPLDGDEDLAQPDGDPNNPPLDGDSLSQYKYIWHFGDGINLEPQIKTIHNHKYKVPGIFEAWVTVIDDEGNETRSNTIKIKVLEEDIKISLNADRTSGFPGLETMFFIHVLSGKAPFEFTFDFGDGKDPETQNSGVISHVYSKVGEYTVTATVVDARGFEEKQELEIEVIDSVDVMEITSNFTLIATQLDNLDSPHLMADVLGQGAQTTDDFLASLHNAPDEEKILGEEAVQENIETLLEDINEQIETFENELIEELIDSIGPIVDELSDIISSMTKNNVELSNNIIEEIKAIADIYFLLQIEATLTDKGLSEEEIKDLVSDPEKLEQYLLSNPEILDNVYEASIIPIDAPKDLDRDEIEKKGEELGVPSDWLNVFQSSIPENIDIEKDIQNDQDSEDPDANLSILDILIKLLNKENGLDKFFPGLLNGNNSDTFLVEEENPDQPTDPLSGNPNLLFNKLKRYVLSVYQFGILTATNLPEGLHLMPNGSLMGSYDGFQFELFPAASDPVSIAAEIINSFGMEPTFTEDGRLLVESDGLILSLGMGWKINNQDETRAIKSNAKKLNKNNDYKGNPLLNRLFQLRENGMFADNVGTVGFSGSGGSESAGSAYSVLVDYGDGTSQSMPPMIMAETELLAILEKLLPGSSSIDRNTGVLSIDSWNLKPDYTFNPLSDIDTASIEANDGFLFENSGFEFSDYNSDGQIDIKYYSDTPRGYQLLYTAQ